MQFLACKRVQARASPRNRTVIVEMVNMQIAFAPLVETHTTTAFRTFAYSACEMKFFRLVISIRFVTRRLILEIAQRNIGEEYICCFFFIHFYFNVWKEERLRSSALVFLFTSTVDLFRLIEKRTIGWDLSDLIVLNKYNVIMWYFERVFFRYENPHRKKTISLMINLVYWSKKLYIYLSL